MPQLDQIDTFISQIFWLFVSFGLIYFYISRVASPKITDTLKKRQYMITSDIESAKSFKDETVSLTETFEAKLSDSKSESHVVIGESSKKAQLDYNKSIQKIDEELKLDVAKAQAEIESSRDKVLGSLKSEISEYVEEILKGLVGIKVSKKQVEKVFEAK